MDKKYIRQRVEAWIEEQELPTKNTLKPIKRFDGLYPEKTEDREAYFDFIHWAINRENEVLLSIPKQDSNKDFWQVEGDDSISYTFGSADYQEQVPEFNKYHYRVKKILERIKDIAITYSCLSNEDGKERTHTRYKNLVENEFQNQAKVLYETLKKYPQWVNKQKLLERLTELNSKIRTAKKVWNEYAYWE